MSKSQRSLKRYACACFGDFIGRLLVSSGCPQTGFALCMFGASLGKVMKFAYQLCKSLKLLNRYAYACFGKFVGGYLGVLR